MHLLTFLVHWVVCLDNRPSSLNFLPLTLSLFSYISSSSFSSFSFDPIILGAIVYYQKCLQVCSNPDPTEHVQNGDNPDVNDSATRNYIFMAANVLAMKFYDDLHLSNNYISRVYRVPLKILNKWEVKVLDLLNYSLYLSQAELDQVKLDFVTRIEP